MSLPNAPQSRLPRPSITLNGSPVPVKEFTVTNTAHMSADTFSIILSYGAVEALNPAFSKKWWSEVTAIQVSIGVGYITSGFDQQWETFPTQLVAGQVDLIKFDWLKKQVTISGRDSTSVFIDHKIESDKGAFTNLSSSQIVSQLAVSRGFTQNQITSTTTKAGTYFGGGNAMMMQDRTEWDLMTFLAQQEGFIVAFIGNGIYFGKAGSGEPYSIEFSDSTDYSISFANVKSLETEHNLTLARGVDVTVQTFSQNDGIPHSRSLSGKPKGITLPAGSSPASYVISVPNGTAAQVQAEAQKRFDQFISHEKPIEVTLPGDETLTILQPLQLTGTGTAWDANYPIDTITRSMSFQSGFEMTIRAQTGTPQVVSIDD